ncbi:hypothetical protein LOZ12_002254 [Ophidiomyces ophidiicola]|uniref:Uncharacterized protein n=1 Tax=Ophidiomyces ophidiicola TaxID=1387563 RepID=A0ACB8UYY5_9EURO|nr:hypothetical protein LOZ64_002048 [Ophidiomyces ophidiicola]KAI1950046.1 hypothetical protein LOZ62_002029 [Ophidiomyces ophidiicola]KAI1959443.1 hypothetical protein LOZ59_003046 [Ophidiomyces ophidiicola]KAI1973782.1 hypothetical protein LOZ56_001638 [Ophidiomyces ophidiicola]KAI2032278.1 hypothetical protein LOZ45_001149 [Ophidiomyces ophidiicola]
MSSSPHFPISVEPHLDSDVGSQSDASYHLARERFSDRYNEREGSSPDDDDFEPESNSSDESDNNNNRYLGDDAVRELFLENQDDSDVQIEFTIEDSDQEGEDEHTTYTGTSRVTTEQLFRLLGASGLRRILQTHGLWREHAPHDDNNEDAFVFGSYGFRRRPRRKPAEDLYPKIPSDEGAELMASGAFGSNHHYVDRMKNRRASFAMKMLSRELALGPRGAELRANRALPQGLIPNSVPDKILHFDSRCYSGQFSEDGNFFFCCAQDFKVRMYDTSNPFDWKYYKSVEYPFGKWTITDASLSPDSRFLAYSSINNAVCLAGTDPTSDADPQILDFAKTSRHRDTSPVGLGFSGNAVWGIWSIRFSGDGREIVAGTSDRSVVVYDIETQNPVLRLQNHQDDVNAVCFGDNLSPHILYSGSDDTTLRVWDRRSMANGREAGIFMGHTEGLTYVDSKGDGRYVLSNGKDQMMKLWDLRKMMSTAQFDTIQPRKYSTGFDYRFMTFTPEDYRPHPYDCSVVTFRGHSVLKTLIRCHFSPPGSTNSRYVYTGSEDGKVYIYNLDATTAGTVEVAKATYRTRPIDTSLHDAAYYFRRGDIEWKTCVRDASWHPNAPILAATSWNGWGMSTGTCSIHSWNDDASEDEGDPPVGQSYDSNLEYVEAFNRYTQVARDGSTARGLRSQPVRPQAAESGMVW